MRLRRPPKGIPVFTLKNAKEYIGEHLCTSAPIGIIVAAVSGLCMALATPLYFLGYLWHSLWCVVRYCTYSLTDDEEAAVQWVLRCKEETNNDEHC